jgi:cell division protein FtsB
LKKRSREKSAIERAIKTLSQGLEDLVEEATRGKKD